MGNTNKVMKILWLTINRSKRTASHIFTELPKELSKLVKVDIITKDLGDKLAGDYCRNVIKTNKKEPSVLADIDYNSYDIIVTDALFAFMSEPWRNIKQTKCMLLEDQHGEIVKAYTSAAFAKFNFDIFIVRYKNATDKFHPYLSKRKIIWSPHSINPSVFKETYDIRTIKYLLLGAVNNKHYPYRFHARKELQNYKDFKYIPRPKDHSTKWPQGNDYVKVLNSSKYVISCPSIYKYPVIKFFEIAACGAITISPECIELRELGFENNKNILFIPHISLKTLPDFCIDEYSQLSKNAKELIINRHTSKKRAADLLKAFNKV
jgi:hypothetical protein